MKQDKNKKNIDFAEGNYVVTFGTTVQATGSECSSRRVAQVIEVGEFDLFLKIDEGEPFYRSKMSCWLIPPPPREITPIAAPKIGDLVMGYVGHRFTKIEKIVGILIELIDEPPFKLHANVLVGDTTHKVKYHSLIVAERR